MAQQSMYLFPEFTSHSLAVLSMDPVATVSPCGLNARHTISVACPRNVWCNMPVSALHNLQVLSNDPVMILSPYGLLNAMAYTTFLWPSNVKSSSPEFVSHTLHVRSYEPVMNLSPDLLNAQFVSGRMCARKILNR